MIAIAVLIAASLAQTSVLAQTIGFTQSGISYSGETDGTNAIITVTAPAGVQWAGVGYNGMSMDGVSMDIVIPLAGGTCIVSSRKGRRRDTVAGDGGYDFSKLTSCTVNADKSWSISYTRPIQAGILDTATSNFIWAAGIQQGGALNPASTTTDFNPPGGHSDAGSVRGITFFKKIAPSDNNQNAPATIIASVASNEPSSPQQQPSATPLNMYQTASSSPSSLAYTPICGDATPTLTPPKPTSSSSLNNAKTSTAAATTINSNIQYSSASRVQQTSLSSVFVALAAGLGIVLVVVAV